MTPIARRSFLIALSAASVGGAVTAHAVDALPDARFVGFGQAVNDFEIASGQLALARSGNENVRSYATRAIAEHTEAASELAKSRQEAGVSYAPDGSMGPNVQNLLARLGLRQLQLLAHQRTELAPEVGEQLAERFFGLLRLGDRDRLRVR